MTENKYYEEQNQVQTPQVVNSTDIVINVPSTPVYHPATPLAPPSETTSQKSEDDKPRKKAKKEPDYMPIYDEEERMSLSSVTELHEAELKRVGGDKSCHAFFDENDNVVGVDVREAVLSGHQFVKPVANREHGTDSKKTGISLLTYGAQEALTIITVKVARAIGMEVEPFPGSGTTEISDNDFVVINGNGRMAYLYTIEPTKWLRILATFVQPDRASLINPFQAFAEMNLHNTKWTAADMACKHLATDGNKVHEGWRIINSLLKEGYKYQAACQVVTLGVDRIKANEANSGSANDLFEDIEDAKTIHEAVVHRFGNIESIKGKFFTKCISECWRKLRKEYGNNKATSMMVEVIDNISGEVINEINNATNDKNGLKKDQKRANILVREYNEYFGVEQD